MKRAVSRDQVQLQITTNLVSAKILKRDEADSYIKLLEVMDLRELLAALVESHTLREKSIDPINFYFVGEICPN